MDNTFKNVMNAAAYSTSNFVKKMYEAEKENSASGIDGVYFETTITVLDKDNNPVMVTRSTIKDAPQAALPKAEPAAPQVKAPVVEQGKPAPAPTLKISETVQQSTEPKESVDSHEGETAPQSEAKSAEVKPVMSVPPNNFLNSNMAVKKTETKQADEKPQQASKESSEPSAKSTLSRDNEKKQKIEDLLKKYSSLD